MPHCPLGAPRLAFINRIEKGVPQVHFRIPVMEDGILDNLPNIKGYVLDDGVVEQGTLSGYFTHIRRQDETRRDEVMPDLGNIDQILGLEVHDMLFTI